MVGLINKEDIHDIADAIRAKLGIEDTFKPSEMADLISSIRVIPENSYQLNSISQTPLATFDASAMPMPKLKVSVDAVQDLHGYDKPWAGGAGKNLLPLTIENLKAWNTSGTWSGNVYENSGMTFTILTDDVNNVIGIEENGTTTSYPSFKIFSGTLNGSYRVCKGETRIRVIVNNTQVNDGATDYSFAASGETCEIYLFTGAITINHHIAKPMLVLATETDYTFEPYSNICPISGWDEANVTVADDVDNPTVTHTTTIPFTDGDNPLTVYGGTLDVISGELVVDRAEVDLGTLTWTKYDVPQGTLFRASISDIKIIANQYVVPNIVCSQYFVIAQINRVNGSITQVANSASVDVIDNRYSDATSFKSAMSGVQLVYELATPITYQLTPTQVNSLLGANNLWADTGDILEGEYFKAL